jgi:hypothetical protein
MKAQLILAQAGERLALFVNAKLVVSYSNEDELEFSEVPSLTTEHRVRYTAEQLAEALQAPLCKVTIPPFADMSLTWPERFDEALEAALGAPSPEHESVVVYAWEEGGVHPDTQDGPGDAWSEVCTDVNPPEAGTPFIVLVPLAQSRARAEDAVRASVLEDFKHWLNDRRDADVSSVFHETVAKVQSLINLTTDSPAGQPKSVDVRYWDAYTVTDLDAEAPWVNTHRFEIDDARDTSGQARLVLSNLEAGNLHNVLDILVEVNQNPLSGLEHLQCAHVHIDGDDPLVTLFRIGDKLLAVPNTGVRFVSDSVVLNGKRESVLWIE